MGCDETRSGRAVTLTTPGPDLSGLFTPFRLRSLTLKNRVVMPAMGLSACRDGAPDEAHADYYARRATGGAALVFTEGVYIDHPASGDNPLLGRFYGERCFEAWRSVAAKVHGAGAWCMPELWHVGLIYRTAEVMTGDTPVYRPELGLVSPSGYIEPGKQVAEGMTQAQIDAVIEAYGRGAAMAKALGFDGVNIQAGHGFLIDQFFWGETNKRADAYGGDVRARTRFACEVVAECRRQLGPEMPIVMRISQFKVLSYHARVAETPQEMEQWLTPLADAGVDLFDCSQRRFWEPAFEGSDLNLAGWAKKVSGKPTMTVGSVGLDCDLRQSMGGGQVANRNLASLEELARRFDRGDFDLVAVGRGMIAQPDWADVVRRGALDELRPFSPSMIDVAVRPKK